MLRLNVLHPQLCIHVQARLASTSTASRFPFPNHSSPSAHQIFHLQPSASQQDIKSRYYDLVRIYHPDSPSCRFDPPAERHQRFQAIRSAYDALRKGTTGMQSFDVYAEEVARRKRMYQKQHARRASYATENRYDWNSNPDDRWKDHMIIAFGVISIFLGVAPGLFLFPFTAQQRHKAAVMNLSQARREAQEDGHTRRNGVRERVRGSRNQDLDASESRPS